MTLFRLIMKNLLFILFLFCPFLLHSTQAQVVYEEDFPNNWGFGLSVNTGCIIPTASLKRVLNVMPSIGISMDGRFKNLYFGLDADMGLSKRKRDLIYKKDNEVWEKGKIQSLETIAFHVGHTIYNAQILRVTPQAFIGANLMPPIVDGNDDDENSVSGTLAYGPGCLIDYKLFGWGNDLSTAIRLYYQFNVANLDKHYSDSMGNFHRVGLSLYIEF